MLSPLPTMLISFYIVFAACLSLMFKNMGVARILQQVVRNMSRDKGDVTQHSSLTTPSSVTAVFYRKMSVILLFAVGRSAVDCLHCRFNIAYTI